MQGPPGGAPRAANKPDALNLASPMDLTSVLWDSKHWTYQEDEVLLRHAVEHGTKHWGDLHASGKLPRRDNKACCNRFLFLKKRYTEERPHLQASAGTKGCPVVVSSRQGPITLGTLTLEECDTIFFSGESDKAAEAAAAAALAASMGLPAEVAQSSETTKDQILASLMLHEIFGPTGVPQQPQGEPMVHRPSSHRTSWGHGHAHPEEPTPTLVTAASTSAMVSSASSGALSSGVSPTEAPGAVPQGAAPGVVSPLAAPRKWAQREREGPGRGGSAEERGGPTPGWDPRGTPREQLPQAAGVARAATGASGVALPAATPPTGTPLGTSLRAAQGEAMAQAHGISAAQVHRTVRGGAGVQDFSSARGRPGNVGSTTAQGATRAEAGPGEDGHWAAMPATHSPVHGMPGVAQVRDPVGGAQRGSITGAAAVGVGAAARARGDGSAGAGAGSGGESLWSIEHGLLTADGLLTAEAVQRGKERALELNRSLRERALSLMNWDSWLQPSVHPTHRGSLAISMPSPPATDAGAALPGHTSGTPRARSPPAAGCPAIPALVSPRGDDSAPGAAPFAPGGGAPVAPPSWVQHERGFRKLYGSFPGPLGAPRPSMLGHTAGAFGFARGADGEALRPPMVGHTAGGSVRGADWGRGGAHVQNAEDLLLQGGQEDAAPRTSDSQLATGASMTLREGLGGSVPAHLPAGQAGGGGLEGEITARKRGIDPLEHAPKRLRHGSPIELEGEEAEGLTAGLAQPSVATFPGPGRGALSSHEAAPRFSHEPHGSGHPGARPLGSVRADGLAQGSWRLLGSAAAEGGDQGEGARVPRAALSPGECVEALGPRGLALLDLPASWRHLAAEPQCDGRGGVAVHQGATPGLPTHAHQGAAPGATPQAHHEGTHGLPTQSAILEGLRALAQQSPSLGVRPWRRSWQGLGQGRGVGLESEAALQLHHHHQHQHQHLGPSLRMKRGPGGRGVPGGDHPGALSEGAQPLVGPSRRVPSAGPDAGSFNEIMEHAVSLSDQLDRQLEGEGVVLDSSAKGGARGGPFRPPPGSHWKAAGTSRLSFGRGASGEEPS